MDEDWAAGGNDHSDNEYDVKKTGTTSIHASHKLD
jgi:hypothetical protein